MIPSADSLCFAFWILKRQNFDEICAISSDSRSNLLRTDSGCSLLHVVVSHQTVCVVNDGLSSLDCLRREHFRPILLDLLDAAAEVIVLDVAWRDEHSLDDLLEHDVVVHGFGGDLCDFGKAEFDESVAFRAEGLRRPGEAQPRDGSELREIAAQLFFVESMRQVLDVNDTATSVFRRFLLQLARLEFSFLELKNKKRGSDLILLTSRFRWRNSPILR